MSQESGLKVEGVCLSFGEVQAINDVNFEVMPGEIVAIIGPNGSGKTSLLNCISGFYRHQKGSIYFNNRSLNGMAPHNIPRLGIARTFQNIELFDGLTTVDNLMAARHIFFKTGFISGAFYYGRGKAAEIKHRKVVEDIIDFLEIAPIRKAVVGALPYGMRKRVELGRALALEPQILLLDEPMAGMNVEEKEDMARFVLDVHEEKGISIVLIEHDMGVVMDLAQRVVVLDFGHKIAEGPPEEIKANPRVIKAYLGKGTAVGSDWVGREKS